MSKNRLLGLAQAVLSRSKSFITVIDDRARLYNVHSRGKSFRHERVRFAETLQTRSQRQIQKYFRNMPEECKPLFSKKTQKRLDNLAFFMWLSNLQNEAIIVEIEQWNNILCKELFRAFTSIHQVNSLMKLSKDLEQTGKLVEDSKLKIDCIIKKLYELNADLSKIFQAMMAGIKTEKVHTAVLEQMSSSLLFLSIKVTDVRQSIDQLRVEFSGKIISLDDQRNGAIRDAWVNVSQVAGNLIECILAGAMYSAGLCVIKLLTTPYFAIMSVVKYQQSQLTVERIEELSEILKTVETFEKDVKDIQKIICILAATAWMKEQKSRRQVAKIAAQH